MLHYPREPQTCRCCFFPSHYWVSEVLAAVNNCAALNSSTFTSTGAEVTYSRSWEDMLKVSLASEELKHQNANAWKMTTHFHCFTKAEWQRGTDIRREISEPFFFFFIRISDYQSTQESTDVQHININLMSGI